MDIQIGVPGQLMPPADRAVSLAQRNEADGFDAVWWPCHLMGWHSDSVWTPDMTPFAAVQPSPHTYFDPLLMMAAVGSQTSRIKVGVVVTDLLRRHPAMVANMALTLDHLTQGRAVLGLGSGERMNVVPYGVDFSRPVSRLAEGIEVIRLLWGADGPVNYEGRFFHLKDAVLGLAPYSDRPPPLWTAAHGPRMLAITGRLADGWLPTKLSPQRYAEALGTIREASLAAGRDADAVTPGLLAYVLVAPDEASLRRLQEAPMVRALMVMLPAEVFESLGVEPPEGFHELVPASLSRPEALAVIDGIPPRVVDYYCFCGTPEQIAEQVAEYHAAGLRHLVMWNITPFGDPSLAGWSFKALGEVKDILRSRP
ncbi:MAG: LLM class flavin-dependent oxidoreductase [bacterium]|nr:LLM class flavin-dependent oxidoreductase [bacterium]